MWAGECFPLTRDSVLVSFYYIVRGKRLGNRVARDKTCLEIMGCALQTTMGDVVGFGCLMLVERRIDIVEVWSF